MKKLTKLSIAAAAAVLTCITLAHAQTNAGQPVESYCTGTGEVEVRIATDDPRVVLAGTLLVPESAQGGTVILMVTGTCDHIRDQIISGAPTFPLIAGDLADAGVATLRLDVRGAGAATGPKASQSTMAERVRDTCAALRWLRSGEPGTFEEIGILRHSAGPTIATELVARECATTDFVILLGAPALKGSDVWVAQQAAPFRDVIDNDDPTTFTEVLRRLELAAALSIGTHAPRGISILRPDDQSAAPTAPPPNNSFNPSKRTHGSASRRCSNSSVKPEREKRR